MGELSEAVAGALGRFNDESGSFNAGFQVLVNKAGGFGLLEEFFKQGSFGKGIDDFTKFSLNVTQNEQRELIANVVIFGKEFEIPEFDVNRGGTDPSGPRFEFPDLRKDSGEIVFQDGDGNIIRFSFKNGKLDEISNRTFVTSKPPGHVPFSIRPVFEDGKLVGFADGGGTEVDIKFEYDTNGNVIAMINGDKRLDFTYNNGVLVAVTSPDGTTQMIHNTDCLPVRTILPNGQERRVIYDLLTNLPVQILDENSTLIAEISHDLDSTTIDSPTEKLTVNRNQDGTVKNLVKEDKQTGGVLSIVDPVEIIDALQNKPEAPLALAGSYNPLEDIIVQSFDLALKEFGMGNAFFNFLGLRSKSQEVIAPTPTEVMLFLVENAAAETGTLGQLKNPFNTTRINSIGAVDPNEILGPGGFGPQQFLAPSTAPLPYTIYYENLESATAPAQEVFITQQLDTDLDFNTFELGDFQFANTTIDVPAGLNQYQTIIDLTETDGILLEFSAGLNFATGIASWTFRSLDPETGDLTSDPFAGYLPPNITSPEGQGSVHYTISMKQGLVTGDAIDARAEIVFDRNEAIETNTHSNTIDDGSPASSVNALPNEVDSAEFTVSWSGQDDPGGSGIATFDVFVSEDGDPFQLFLDDTTATSANFTGEHGKRYGFFSVATDNVGLVQPTPDIEQTFTTVVLNAAPISGDDSAITGEETAVTLNVLANDSDLDNDPLNVVSVTDPANGTAVINSDNTITYTPDVGFEGDDTFQYTIDDSNGAQATASVIVTVVNVAPSVTINGAPASSPEGTVIDLTSTVIDPGSTDTHTFDWQMTRNGSPFANGTSANFSFVPDDDGTYNVFLSVLDNSGGQGTDNATIVVTKVVPTLDISITGPDNGVRGQHRLFTLKAGTTGISSQGFTYVIDWGDGSPVETIGPNPGNGDGVDVGHVFADSGYYTVSVTASDAEGNVSVEATLTIEITPFALQPDGTGSEKPVLVVGGSAGNDRIYIGYHPFRDQFLLRINEVNNRVHLRGKFDSPLERIVVNALAGDDIVLVAGNVSVATLLYGGPGNDVLLGGRGDDVLLGGVGNDLLLGYRGRDFLIGGEGRDYLFGGSDEDLLISGYTIFDDDESALLAIMAEWTSSHSFADRRSNLFDGSGSVPGLNGEIFLNADTVLEDDDCEEPWTIWDWCL